MNKVFGLVGPIASGKGTVVAILKDQGYRTYSLSDRIREEITSRGLIIDRNSLNQVSNELRATLGADILALRTVELIKKDIPELVVVDSIRNPSEVKYIKENLNAAIIGIDAPQDKRYEMFAARGNNSQGIKNFEQFAELDNRETAGIDSHSQRVADSLAMADVVIQNDGTIKELEEKVEKIINS